MRSVGLDISTYVGMALAGDGEDRGKVVHLTEARGFLRLHLIANEVKRTLNIWQPEIVIVEGYGFRNRFSLVMMVEIGTVVRTVLYDLAVPWYLVPPTVLKMWVTGKGVASKEQMAVAVTKRWGFSSPSDDIVDAYALAQMGQLEKSALLQIRGVVPGV